ncbi:hypothetical protein PG984_013323 [Apiospora sp. TS-2023a]
MEGITASDRLEDLGEFAKQRPQTEEATWRLLGALSFMSPVHNIPASVFQPYSFSSMSEVTTSGTTTSPAVAASAPSRNTTKDASGVKARARRELNDRKMLQDPLPWVVITTTTTPTADDGMDPNNDDTVIGNNSGARNGSVAIQNLFEEALQPLLETGIVHRAHVRGPIIHIDQEAQALYRNLTIKKHGQRDFDLAVRMMLRAMPTSSPIITPSSSPSSPVSPSATASSSALMPHVMALASHYEKHAGWSSDDKDRSSTNAAATETKNKNDAAAMKPPMFVQSPRFVSTRELEQLTKHTLELSGYQQ